VALRADADRYPMYPDSSASLEWKLDKAKAMLVFMAPALILPLSDPLMSLIDAVCLGQVRSSMH
jgi:hypothetical protein